MTERCTVWCVCVGGGETDSSNEGVTHATDRAVARKQQEEQGGYLSHCCHTRSSRVVRPAEGVHLWLFFTKCGREGVHIHNGWESRSRRFHARWHVRVRMCVWRGHVTCIWWWKTVMDACVMLKGPVDFFLGMRHAIYMPLCPAGHRWPRLHPLSVALVYLLIYTQVQGLLLIVFHPSRSPSSSTFICAMCHTM